MFSQFALFFPHAHTYTHPFTHRWQSHEPLRSISWHHEGKHFVSSHIDGSLCTWPLRAGIVKPQTHIYPHAKPTKDGKLETCKPIRKVEVKTTRNRFVKSEHYIITLHSHIIRHITVVIVRSSFQNSSTAKYYNENGKSLDISLSPLSFSFFSHKVRLLQFSRVACRWKRAANLHA
jgi:hypothetical protein